MKVYHYKLLQENSETCCTKTKVNELTALQTFNENLNIKIFEMQSGGYSPLHEHSAEHRLFITDGEGVVFDGEKNTTIQVGDIIYIKANEPHQLKTKGENPLKFICVTINTK